MNTSSWNRMTRIATRAAAGGLVAVVCLTGLAPHAGAVDGTDILLKDGQMTVTGGPAMFGNVVPGDVQTWIVNVRNETDEPVAITGKVSQLAQDDNGCADPEDDVDVTCGPGGGEAAQAFRLFMVGQGTPIALSDATGQLPTVTVPANSVVQRTLKLELPASTGNVVQSDEVQFATSWTAQGPGFVATPPPLERSKSRLAFTGAWISALALLGAGMLAVGTGLVMSSRRRSSGQG